MKKGGPKAAPVVTIWRRSQLKRFDDPDQQARNPKPHVDQPESRQHAGPEAHGHCPFGGGVHVRASN